MIEMWSDGKAFAIETKKDIRWWFGDGAFLKMPRQHVENAFFKAVLFSSGDLSEEQVLTVTSYLMQTQELSGSRE